MHATLTFCALVACSLAATLPAQYLFSNPPDAAWHRIPTVHESAVQARRMLRLETIGTLSTVFPSGHGSSREPPGSAERRPAAVAGAPVGLMEYFGDCEPQTGNPTLLALGIATSFKNVAAGSNLSLSLHWHPPSAARLRSSVALPRFSLIGYLEDVPEADVRGQDIAGCFLRRHPDATAWLPGNDIHESRWTRLVIQELYWIGGFGDRAYIGWIPVEDWRSVTEKEIQRCRLPGEEWRNGEWLDG